MTRPARLALIRHGESTWIVDGRFQGQGDPPLSTAGERQAAAVGARMARPSQMPSVPVPDRPPVAIWHSPLQRATQTALAVHEARGADAPLRPLDGLKELGQGDWEGRTHTEVAERWPAELAAWRDDPLHNQAPGGESLVDGLTRVRAAREIILAGDATDAQAWSIVVAHDGILRLMMLDLLDIGIEHFWSFPLTLASVTVVDLSSDVAQLRAHNLDAHIAALGRVTERPPGAL